MENEATTSLQAKLDKQSYDASSLVEIRVPLNMPYITDWNDFETFEGETEINGIHYKYVKRKVDRGDLVLLCIPNEQKTNLRSAEHNFFKLVNDLGQPTGKKQSKDHSVKIAMSDCINNQPASLQIVTAGASSAYAAYAVFVVSSFIAVPSQPPEC